jgi:putative flippase GtrA
MTVEIKLPLRLIYFSSIGATAASVHILVVLCLVTYVQIHPLIANIFGFLIAFNVSYLGHKYVTFSQLQDQKQLSLPHYFLVASSAGILNELLYYILLSYTHLNYLIALILVLGFVALYTYTASRFWACR